MSMSSVVVNDENQGVCSVRKSITSETTGDIFALNQPTGRPSILRQSQAENLKNFPKGVKVCFQTPLRDPVTRKIMSPSRVGKMDSMDDCTQALESLSLSVPTETSLQCGPVAPFDGPGKNYTPYPDDDMPIKGKGGYVIDFDNLESMNPFQGSSAVVLSPPKPSVISSTTEPEQHVVFSSTSVHEEVVRFPEKPGQTDMALDETLPFTPSVENSLADLSVDRSDTTVIIEPKNSVTPAMDHSSTEAETLEIAKQAPTSDSCLIKEDPSEAVDSPLPPKGSYKIDLDDLDSFNPFQTGGSKIQNSPPLGRKVLVNKSPPYKTEDEVSEPKKEADASAPQLLHAVPEEKPNDAEMLSATFQAKDSHVLLEFNSDGADVKRKPPPKCLGVKRPPASKPATKKNTSALAEKKTLEVKLKPETSDPTNDRAPVDVPVARGAYSFDFDKFDDPNFNPFGTSAKMGNSPPHEEQSDMNLVAPSQAEAQQPDTPTQSHQLPDQHVENSRPSFRLCDDEKTAENEPSLTKPEVEAMPCTAAQSDVPHSPTSHKPIARVVSPELRPCSQRAEFDTVAADEEFVPGSIFMPTDFDGQIDYLEQFGCTAFKESALRKQSLYLKFDPLLKESPKKAAADNHSSAFSLPRPSLAIRMMEAARSEVRQKCQQESTKLLDDFPPPADTPVMKDPTVLDLLVPTFKQAQKSEDFIVDVLKYSEKDMDAAMERARKQAEEKEEGLKMQIEKLHLDNQHMMFKVSECEAFISQSTAAHKQKEELAKVELSKLFQEKQQLAKDLNDMERSFSNVLRRLDKCKEVFEGFKKNEETLKQCAQNYLARLQKEEQRYQMLKSHAEEKIDQANKEIAEVRSKLSAEVSTLQVQLRREQLKVQSLEKNLEQKAKEVEDVTKLCDELIMKVQKQ
ncbi:transforming acidic coiled-coil-containing protein 3 [Electrophorus electricus]|uniref:Transforming acidic coiled-coil-containing protein C-terminal domain-containing protein n=1 Tax=Electrophorus electricus TaxID=8005 RepID=A0A4W4EEV5_ELEEL|nr:transforming acidic coiled-coil-containing protein 3 [Electrophorus electricus]